ERTERKNFGELVARLSADLRQAKQEKHTAPFFSALPIHRRCQSCGKRPANHLDTEVTPNEWLCEICHQKRCRGRKKRSTFTDEFAKWFKCKYDQKVPGKPAKDLDDLAGREGRLAFLYADGNNMGDLLQRAKTPAQYRHISEALDTAVREALFEALMEAIGRESLLQSQRLPFEIIAVGGDDVTVIVPAQYGWQLTLKLLEKFEKKVKHLKEELKLEKSITMSAGLVVADVKYPVRFMQRLSEGLLKEAKRLARERKTESTLCHLWLRAPIASEDAKTVLDALYLREDKRLLTARPFTLKQACRLIGLARDLKELPPHQRRLLAEALERGVHTSLNTALYQAQRLDDEQRKTLLRTFRELGELISNGRDLERFLFWQREDDEWRTALLDALELIELGGV
ncbi:MAG: phosphohydrolase, partial [Candidatus Thorarchaeota archaeon]